MVAGLLASAPACSSGIGFRTEPNPWDQICAHEKTYLDSEQSGEPSQIQSAITNLNKDRALFPDDETGTEWLDRVYQGAVAGNPQVARQFWSGNCAHVPYDPPTSSGGPARPSAHPSSK
jgi:hypothetical protein